MNSTASAVRFAPGIFSEESSSTIQGAAWDWGRAFLGALVRVAPQDHGTVAACEDELRRLAGEEPRVLVALLEANALRVADMTFAAEILGDIEDSMDVVPLLTRLLRHDSPIVREGAVYGLLQHASRVRAYRRSALAAISSLLPRESSPGVLAAATEAISLLTDLQ